MKYLNSLSVVLTCLIFFSSEKSYATTVFASSFGWNAADASIAFNTAIKSNYDTVIIDLQASDWIINPTYFDSIYNKTIIFQPDVNLVAKAGAFSATNANLLRFNESINVTLIGYGATLRMQKSEYIAYNNSQYRFCLALYSCSNIKIYGFKIMDSGGDGVYISGYQSANYQKYSDNILLKDLWCDNHYRQGISLISVQHLRVERCWFTNTIGTAPQAGLDIEPYLPTHRMVDVVFDKCRFTGNEGGGIKIIPFFLDSTSMPLDITFNNCYVADNGVNRYQIGISGDESGITGTVTFNNCMTDGGTYSVGGSKLATGYKANFNNCVFQNPSDIVVNFDDYTTSISGIRNGGVSFTDCSAFYNTTKRFFNVWHANANSAGLDDVQFNNFTVINPNSVTYNNGGNITANCVFNFQQFTTVPVTNVSYSLGNSLVECDTTNSLLGFSRTASSDSTFPIAMTYTIAGTGVQGFDYSRMNGFEIIPQGLYSQLDTFLVLQDTIIESTKQDTVVINPSMVYSTSLLPKGLLIEDCNVVSVGEPKMEVEVFIFPNPTFGNVQIQWSDHILINDELEICNYLGQMVMNVFVLNNDIVDVSGLPHGIYFLRLKNIQSVKKMLKN